jgi:hypothetical protein
VTSCCFIPYFPPYRDNNATNKAPSNPTIIPINGLESANQNGNASRKEESLELNAGNFIVAISLLLKNRISD